MDIYWERQEGSLCRKHSLNAYFGCAKISTSEFTNYCKEYDDYIFDKYDIKINTLTNDYVLSNDIGLLSYIIRKVSGIYCFHFPINHIKETVKKLNLKDIHSFFDENNFIFGYNHDHVWGFKKKDGRWKKVDSLSGISDINIKSIIDDKNIGFIIPRQKDMGVADYNLLKNSIRDNISQSGFNHECLGGIRNMVIEQWNRGELIGYLEPLCGTLIDIFATINHEHEIIPIYHNFLKFFERNKTDNVFICSWFPLIVDRLLNSSYGIHTESIQNS